MCEQSPGCTTSSDDDCELLFEDSCDTLSPINGYTGHSTPLYDNYTTDVYDNNATVENGNELYNHYSPCSEIHYVSPGIDNQNTQPLFHVPSKYSQDASMDSLAAEASTGNY